MKDIDLFVGILAEKYLPDGILGKPWSVFYLNEIKCNEMKNLYNF